MMKPRVGLTLFTSSFMICLTIVVFPALSKPLFVSWALQKDFVKTHSINIRISLSFSRAFRKIDNILSWGWRSVVAISAFR
jgi:hypothetical protein